MSSAKISPVNRLLLLAPPGQGKTTLLKEVVKRYRIVGRIFDPINDFSDAGDRWAVYPFKEIPSPRNSGYRKFASVHEEIEYGELVAYDEANRFLPTNCGRNNLVYQFLDTARNRGVKFILAEKRPTRLDSLVTDLATHFAFRPWRSAAAIGWLRAADVDSDGLEPLPLITDKEGKPNLNNPWYLLKVGGEIERVTAGDLIHGICSEENFRA